MDANTGQIVAAALTTNDVDDASRVGPLLDQLEAPLASFTRDGAYDQDSLYRAVIDWDADALVIVRPRATAALSETAATKPTQRDQHLQDIADRGRIGWLKAAGYTKRSRVETAIGRYKQVNRDALSFHKDERRDTEVRIALQGRIGVGLMRGLRRSMQQSQFRANPAKTGSAKAPKIILPHRIGPCSMFAVTAS